MAEDASAVAEATPEAKTATPDATDDGSLLHGEPAETPDSAKTGDSADTVIAHAQVPDPNAERPPWLPEKYKSAEDFRKGYDELQTAFSQGKHKAPKDGKYDLSAFGEKVNGDDPALKMFTGWAQKYGLSQEAFNEFSKQFMDLGNSLAAPEDDPATYRAAELAKLGENGPQLVKGAADWGRSLINRGILSADEWSEFQAMAGSAGGVRILLKMRELIEGPLPISPGPIGEDMPSKEELEAMVGKPEYLTDPAYRQKVERLFAKAFPG